MSNLSLNISLMVETGIVGWLIGIWFGVIMAERKYKKQELSGGDKK